MNLYVHHLKIVKLASAACLAPTLKVCGCVWVVLLCVSCHKQSQKGKLLSLSPCLTFFFIIPFLFFCKKRIHFLYVIIMLMLLTSEMMRLKLLLMLMMMPTAICLFWAWLRCYLRNFMTAQILHRVLCAAEPCVKINNFHSGKLNLKRYTCISNMCVCLWVCDIKLSRAISAL